MHNEDVNFKGILAFLGLLALTLTVAYLVLIAMWRHFEKNARQSDEKALRQAPGAAAESQRPYFPLPREQPVPAADLETLRAREEAELNSYGWIDKTSGVVHIPINRALELMSPSPKGTP